MIRLDIDDNGSLRMEQRLDEPAVYLDHCALMMISEDEALRDRFARAIRDTGGTLMISWVNVVEFILVTDSHQAEAVEGLVEEVLPNVFLLDSSFLDVIEREDELLRNGPPTAPHGDVEFLRALLAQRPEGARPITARQLFRAVQGERDLERRYNGLAETIIERVESLREEMDNNEGFRARVRQSPRGSEVQRGTRHILRELLRSLLVDRKVQMTRNNAIDLLHSVVPVAYGDLVLLDGHWEAQVENMRRRFSKAGMSVPVARVFSLRHKGVERFLQAMDSDRERA